jgi:hypothetical protein
MAASVLYRRYLAVRSESGGEIEYIPIEKVLNDQDLQDQVIDQPLLAKIIREKRQPINEPKAKGRK